MFRKLLTLAEAQKILQQEFKPKPLGIEEVSLLEAGNRVIGEDVKANLSIPPFNRSTVDGYAVKAEDTFGAEENMPAILKICGSINIGEPPAANVEKNRAAEIVTGAPMPKGANAVVMVEHTHNQGEEILVFRAVAKGENVMKAGADIQQGETVLKRGQILGSREIGVLAALGLAKVKVFAVPRVAVLSTGPEVAEPGGKLPFGKIYDINAYSLSTAVLESGGKPIFLGISPDSLDELERALKHALASADMVLTSGGVSVGPKDIVPKALYSLGKPDMVVCGIAIKPGKPTIVTSVDKKPVFSLPGHPASALLVFYLLVHPMIQAMAGRGSKKGLEVQASLSMRLFPARGRRTFVMVKLKRQRSSMLVAEPISVSESGAITTLARADGFVEIPENLQFVDAGEMVIVHLFRSLA